MERTTQGLSGNQDASLVAAALDGGNDAVAVIYERYADRVHTMCVHMLGDRDEAADVCGEVFLVAFTRLGQLRDPERLGPWLFAIARHEVYRRTRRRSRVELIEEVDEMDRIATARNDDHTIDDHTVEDHESAAELTRVVRDAAAGLDARDRMVLELQLQGLNGDDLASALGTSSSTAYQSVHRMKERLERSVGAVLVARQGREDCAQLDDLLGSWDGTFSVIWRKRVARHVDGCEVCERRRRAVPAALLGAGATTLPMLRAGAVSAAPASVRERVLAEATVGAGGRGWRNDGFPPSSGRNTAKATIAAIVVALVLVGLVVAMMIGGETVDELLVEGDTAPASTTTGAPTVSAPSTSTTMPTPPAPPDAPPDAPTTVAPTGPVEPSPVPPVIVGEPLPPLPPPAAPEPRTLAVSWAAPIPATVYHPLPALPTCSASGEFAVIAPTSDTVQLRWSGSGEEGVVEMLPVAERWEAVLEVPPSVVGPLTVVAVGTASGASGSSAPVTVAVASCVPPG